MIFWSWSEHLWPDLSVQWTFLMDCQWTNNKPATKMTRTDAISTDIERNSDGHSQEKSNGLQASRLVISNINEKEHE